MTARALERPFRRPRPAPRGCWPEYGGWGIRTISLKKNIAYTISGDKGLQIELKDGKKILLGTQNPEEVEKIVSQITHITP